MYMAKYVFYYDWLILFLFYFVLNFTVS
jgi:hypothetical protein